MNPPPSTSPSRSTRLLAGAAALGLVVLAGVGCAKEDTTAGADGTNVKITLTDSGCEPSPATAKGGTVAFEVVNDGANGVSEAELKSGDGNSILGEKENLSPGLSGAFKLNLAAGSYRIYCPGATQDTWEFTVAGGTEISDWNDNPELVEAIDGYADYVNAQAAELVTTTKAFVAAVVDGDVDAAKAAYVAARLPYERIEPVAESFGELDPRIDGRLGDNGDAPEDFLGFHRIERALWVDESLDGMAAIATTLEADVTELASLIEQKSGTYEPNEITNGAVELMNEVLVGKITGEEERYSHIDLVDFQANLEGSVKTVDLLRPVLDEAAPDLLAKIDAATAATQDALDELKADPGYADTGFVEWSCATDESGELPEGCTETTTAAVTDAQRRALADVVKPLAELLAEVPVKVVR